MRDVAYKETIAGSPAVPVREWHKQTIVLKRLVDNKRD
jgi:UDP-3-O-[3-hydroxymyristoyl] glucosamine N-acyltransferase